jgi:hypothetical protein
MGTSGGEDEEGRRIGEAGRLQRKGEENAWARDNGKHNRT